MNQAIAGKGKFPVANWVHRFTEFRDILEVLKTGFNISKSLERVALITHLKAELCSNLAWLTLKYKEQIILTHRFVVEAMQFYDGETTSSSNVPGKDLKELLLYVLRTTRASNLSTQFIDQALLSGQFLEFDRNLNTFRSGILDTALAQLRENINNLKKLVEEEPSKAYLQNFVLKYGNVPNTAQLFAVENLELFLLFGMANLQENVVQLSIALFKALEGDKEKLSKLKVKSPSPIQVGAKKIPTETPAKDDVVEWINKLATPQFC